MKQKPKNPIEADIEATGNPFAKRRWIDELPQDIRDYCVEVKEKFLANGYSVPASVVCRSIAKVLEPHLGRLLYEGTVLRWLRR